MAKFPGEQVVKLTISEDKLTAYLEIKDFSYPNQQLLSRVKELLAHNNVQFGLQLETLKKYFFEKQANSPFVIAQGKPPIHPTPSSFQKLIDFDTPVKKVKQKSGRIDNKEVIRETVVKKGTPLLRILAGQAGSLGVDITGQKIEPPAVETNEIPIQLGQNVAHSPRNPDLIIASQPGLAILTPTGEIGVTTTFNVEEDVDYETGNIRFPGTVVIKGDVRAGFKVLADVDVIVHGSVKDAMIEAGRDIVIGKGFVGSMRGFLRAGRDIQVGYAHYQKLFAYRDLNFDVELIGCHIEAGRHVTSNTGRIVGGKCDALEKIKIATAGSEEEVFTVLVTGKKETLNEIIIELEEELNALQKSEIEINKQIYNLAARKYEEELDDVDLEMLEILQNDKKNLKNKAREMKEELTQLNQKKKLLRKSTIVVNGLLSRNVEIQIRGNKRMNFEKQRFVSFKEVDDKLELIPS